jgi:hypothetical protein
MVKHNKNNNALKGMKKMSSKLTGERKKILEHYMR